MGDRLALRLIGDVVAEEVWGIEGFPLRVTAQQGVEPVEYAGLAIMDILPKPY